MTNVRVVMAPWSGWLPGGSAVNGHHLIVLADDTGHRAVPLWLRVRGAKGELVRLLHPPAGDRLPIDGHWQEIAARLLQAAGVAVTAVDIEPASEDAAELRSDTVTARVGLAAAAGTRHVPVSTAYGLALAAIAGAPVRVADAVMDRLAVPVQGEDVLAPFLTPPAARPPGRPVQPRRFEPRNMAFTDGLDWWALAGGFLDVGRPRWQDYSCTAAGGSAVLAAAVPEPAGSAVLVQTIFADDYRGAAVTFRGQLRTTDVAARAGMHLAAGRPGELSGENLRDRGGSSLTGPGSSDWTWHEVTLLIPQETGVIRFGISLTGRGRVELRGAELTPARPGTQELGEHGHPGRRPGPAGPRRRSGGVPAAGRTAPADGPCPRGPAVPAAGRRRRCRAGRVPAGVHRAGPAA
ncbi:MAG: hypothetical protein ACRDPD_08820 [Streptosporangiaceae bacterium]